MRSFIAELTEHAEVRSKRAFDAGLKIVRARGRWRAYSGRYRVWVTGHGFTINHSTPFNPSLLKTDSEEREWWRRFGYRMTISRLCQSCLDVYWDNEDQIFTRCIRVEPWDEKFLKYAGRLNTWS
jgi:hypothetical protein